jgi:hypothetical protein
MEHEEKTNIPDFADLKLPFPRTRNGRTMTNTTKKSLHRQISAYANAVGSFVKISVLEKVALIVLDV